MTCESVVDQPLKPSSAVFRPHESLMSRATSMSAAVCCNDLLARLHTCRNSDRVSKTHYLTQSMDSNSELIRPHIRLD
jgi:hypothetical protein